MFHSLSTSACGARPATGVLGLSPDRNRSRRNICLAHQTPFQPAAAGACHYCDKSIAAATAPTRQDAPAVFPLLPVILCRYTLDRAAVVVEGATVTAFVTEAAAMLVSG